MTEMSSLEKLDALRRRDLYGLLAALFSRPPTSGLIRLLRSGRLPDELGLAQDCPARREFAAFLEESAADRDLERKLTAEHSRLFILPTTLHRRPYESVFLDSQRRLGGKITIGVRRFYDYAGASFIYEDDLADHIGVELEFMAFLAGLETDAVESGLADALRDARRIQSEFLREHLLLWACDLCRQVQEETRSRFYVGLALLTAQFMAEERSRGEAQVPQEGG